MKRLLARLPAALAVADSTVALFEISGAITKNNIGKPNFELPRFHSLIRLGSPAVQQEHLCSHPAAGGRSFELNNRLHSLKKTFE